MGVGALPSCSYQPVPAASGVAVFMICSGVEAFMFFAAHAARRTEFMEVLGTVAMACDSEEASRLLLLLYSGRISFLSSWNSSLAILSQLKRLQFSRSSKIGCHSRLISCLRASGGLRLQGLGRLAIGPAFMTFSGVEGTNSFAAHAARIEYADASHAKCNGDQPFSSWASPQFVRSVYDDHTFMKCVRQ